MSTALVPYVARFAPWRNSDSATFSVGIGRGPTPSRWAPAIYRVHGRRADRMRVDRLADRLASWLNDPNRIQRSPYSVPRSNDRSARIILTPAGKREGWLR